MDEPEPERCCFDDWVDSWSDKATKKPTAAKVTASLLDAITETGVADRTMLDVGCGIGDLAIEVVTRGAASGTGYDLSAKAVEEARKLAAARGVGDRMRFEVGDGAKLGSARRGHRGDQPGRVLLPRHREPARAHARRGGSVFAMTAPVSNGRDRLAQPAVERARERRLPVCVRRSTAGSVCSSTTSTASTSGSARPGSDALRHEQRRVVWDLAVYTR